MNFSSGWHVLYVRSRYEKKVYEALREKSLEAYLPLVETVKQWSDRKKIILKPLFPSYVFVNIHTSLEFHQALSVDGACTYISFGNEYAKVTEKEINKIKLLTGAEEVSNITLDRKPPKIGDIMKITQGVLSGLECEVVRVAKLSKIVVRIESFKQNITATIPSYMISEPSLCR